MGKKYFTTKTRTSYQTSDVHDGRNNLYVYTDIIEPSVVGDIEAPLLRTVGVDFDQQTQTTTLQNLQFHKIRTRHFREITVYLRDSLGDRIPFERGEVYVVLTFRPTSHSGLAY